MGSMEIGLRSFFDLMSLTLGMGLMCAIFHCLGKTCLEMQLFKIFVSGDARLSATIFTNLTGMLSGPQEQSHLISLISLMTSAHVTGRIQKASSLSAGKEFTKSNKCSMD